jgi:hypothetical protein
MLSFCQRASPSGTVTRANPRHFPSHSQRAVTGSSWRPEATPALPAHRPPPRPNRAAVAVGRSILIIAWHLLTDPDTRFDDLGASFYDNHINPDRKKRHYIHELQTLGYRVTLEPAA